MRLLVAFALLAVIVVAPPSSRAQEPTWLLAAGADGTRLVPGTWTYDVKLRLDGEEQRIGTRSLVIERAEQGGTPALRIVESTWMMGTASIDSVVLDRATLRPLRRVLHLGDSRLAVAFGPDSARGTVGSQANATPFAVALPAGAVVSAGMLEVLLRAAPLAAGWSASADLFVVGQAGATTRPTELRITGSETVTVPAGEFAAWTATSASAGVPPQRLWLSRDGGWLLRSESAVPDMPDAMVETVLVGHATAGR